MGNPLGIPTATPGIVDRVSTPDPLRPPPDLEDLRGLARGLRLLVEIGARTLAEDAGPSELALRVTAHLGCELTAVVPVTERFPSWENVNVQRGVDAYLAARHSEPDWFGAAGTGHRPHEDMLSLITMPSHFGPVRILGQGGSPGRVAPVTPGRRRQLRHRAGGPGGEHRGGDVRPGDVDGAGRVPRS